MTNEDFWDSVRKIIEKGFLSSGLLKLDEYADKFINGELVFKRFSPKEQYGCAEGGSTHVIATILSGAENSTDSIPEVDPGLKGIFKQGAQQAALIEKWARMTGVWIDDIDNILRDNLGEQIAEGGEAKVYDNGASLVKAIGLDYYIQPVHALDRISLHNAYFPETRLVVLGFGRDSNKEFKILVSQSFIEGERMSEPEIEAYMRGMGFKLQNPRNWTYITPEIYLSDMHDENVIKSSRGTIFVLDCEIRLNTPDLRKGGIREFSNIIINREQ